MIVGREEIKRNERRGKQERILLLIVLVFLLTGGYGLFAMLLCGDIFCIGYSRRCIHAEDYIILVYSAAFIASLLPAVSALILVDKLGLRDDWVMLMGGVGLLFFLFVLFSVVCMSHYNYIPNYIPPWLPWF